MLPVLPFDWTDESSRGGIVRGHCLAHGPRTLPLAMPLGLD